MFVELYRSVSKADYERSAFNYLVKDKLDAIFSYSNKSKQLTAMEMESSLKTAFIPSMIYTFSYETNMQDKIGKYSFYDIVPVILCTSNDGQLVTGLNFNFLPTDIRALVLDIIYNAFKTFYDKDVDKAVERGEAAINESFAQFLIPDKGISFLNLLNNKLGIKITDAYRTYRREDIKNIRLVEFDEWKYIPFLVFKDAVRGASLAKVQKDIIDEANSNQ